MPLWISVRDRLVSVCSCFSHQFFLPNQKLRSSRKFLISGSPLVEEEEAARTCAKFALTKSQFTRESRKSTM